jgi:phosphatidylglycerol:prolipoprotein diacylglycerol transferase
VITLNIDPIVFSIGHFAVRWYGVFIALGLSAGMWLAAREARRKGLDLKHISDALLWVLPAGLIGARLLHVIDDWPRHAADPWTIIGTDGLAIYGGLIGGLVGVVAYARVHRLALGRLLDVLAPAVPLGQAIGRIGCFINGCNYGLSTDGAWGVVWTSPNAMAPLNVPSQPAQLYELVWDLAVFGIVWKLRAHVKGDGALLAIYAALYSFGRFFISALRPDNLYFGELRQAQLIALAVFAIAIPLVFWLNWRTALSTTYGQA